MPELKLARIPDRSPMKLTITVPPDLRPALQERARLYPETYRREEPVTEPIPAILSTFPERNRGFVRIREMNAREKTK